jgi:hypothetical protein
MIAESVALRAVRSEAPLGDGEKAWQRAVFDLAFFSSLGVWSSCTFFFSFFLNCLSPLRRQLKKKRKGIQLSDVAHFGSQSRPVAPRPRRLRRREACSRSRGIGLSVRGERLFPFLTID